MCTENIGMGVIFMTAEDAVVYCLRGGCLRINAVDARRVDVKKVVRGCRRSSESIGGSFGPEINYVTF